MVYTLWLCGSIVANPILLRLVPSPSRFKLRQWRLYWFTSDWMKKWREFFFSKSCCAKEAKPITFWRSNENRSKMNILRETTSGFRIFEFLFRSWITLLHFLLQFVKSLANEILKAVQGCQKCRHVQFGMLRCETYNKSTTCSFYLSIWQNLLKRKFNLPKRKLVF